LELEAPLWPEDEYIVMVAWAPARDRLLVVGSGGARLFDRDFRPVARLEWPSAWDTSPLAGWLTPDGPLFVLSPQTGADLRFHSADDGALLDAFPLDRAAVLGRGGDAAGDDTWAGRNYRPETNELRLMWYRGNDVSAEPQWVSVRLAP
jgi:hypothetical protein